jgi:hypothetical protein
MVLPERIELSSFNRKSLLDKALREPICSLVYHCCVPVSSPILDHQGNRVKNEVTNG